MARWKSLLENVIKTSSAFYVQLYNSKFIRIKILIFFTESLYTNLQSDRRYELSPIEICFSSLNLVEFFV